MDIKRPVARATGRSGWNEYRTSRRWSNATIFEGIAAEIRNMMNIIGHLWRYRFYRDFTGGTLVRAMCFCLSICFVDVIYAKDYKSRIDFARVTVGYEYGTDTAFIKRFVFGAEYGIIHTDIARFPMDEVPLSGGVNSGIEFQGGRLRLYLDGTIGYLIAGLTFGPVLEIGTGSVFGVQCRGFFQNPYVIGASGTFLYQPAKGVRNYINALMPPIFLMQDYD